MWSSSSLASHLLLRCRLSAGLLLLGRRRSGLLQLVFSRSSSDLLLLLLLLPISSSSSLDYFPSSISASKLYYVLFLPFYLVGCRVLYWLGSSSGLCFVLYCFDLCSIENNITYL
ncbi:hypothetical protein Dsin_008314 [Dipteronia sinensis]|uniref:Uncharacterized protein n=1 Tax=Dipteronia sinensis TaxID=43782 RepID=A0AAE0EAU0_9ROSI|nr:hypothetical protein Dsin_008314 [Dipteronia sinensis]